MIDNAVEVKELRCFVEVVEAGTISVAARRCGMSQPGMSQRMAELEGKLGEQLLQRGRRGVAPTEAGRVLLAHAQRVLQAERALREQFSSREELQSGRVIFGIIPTLAPYLLPLMLREFRMDHPGLEIEVVENQTTRLIQKVAQGDLEFAVLSDVTAEEKRRHGLQVRELFSEPLLAAFPRNHRCVQEEEELTPADLDSKELIHLSDGHCLRDQVLKACRVKQVTRKMQCDQLETALAMVEAGLGVAIIPQLATKKGVSDRLILKRFAEPQPSRQIFMLKKRDVRLSKGALKLVELLKTGGF